MTNNRRLIGMGIIITMNWEAFLARLMRLASYDADVDWDGFKFKLRDIIYSNIQYCVENNCYLLPNSFVDM